MRSIDLAKNFGIDPLSSHDGAARALLRVLRMPHSFRDLTVLKLSKIPLQDDDLIGLSGLRSLVELDLASTGISSEGIAHLVVFKKTLVHLDLTSNLKIKHDAAFSVSLTRSDRSYS